MSEPLSLRYDLDALDDKVATYSHGSRSLGIDRENAFIGGLILQSVWVRLDERPPWEPNHAPQRPEEVQR